MLGGFWIRFVARLVFAPLVISALLVVLSGVIGRLFIPAQQVAFMSDLIIDMTEPATWDIYVMDVNRRIVDRVTWGSGSERFPAWSPDGEKIAFHANQRALERGVREFYDLYTISPDGRNQQLLTENHLSIPDVNYGGQGGSSMAAWSPDGTKIGFHTSPGGGVWDLAVIDVNTREIEVLTQATAEPNIHFEWSPDGTQVVFASERDAMDTGSMDLFMMNIENREITRLTDQDAVYDPNSPAPRTSENYPAWSPGGEWIAFSMSQGGMAENIFLMDADGSNVRQITSSSFQDVFPVWVPDGSGIVFDSDRGGIIANRQLYVVDLATLQVRQLTDMPSSARAATWKPVETQ